MPLLIAASPQLDAIRRNAAMAALSECMARRSGPTAFANGWRDGCYDSAFGVEGGVWTFINGLGWANFDFSAPTNLIPTMTSNTAPSGTASGGTDAWQAFDASTTTLWTNGGAAGESGRLGYVFSASQLVNLYSVVAPAANNKAPSEWTVEGWDGAAWFGGAYSAARVTRQFAWKPGEQRFFTVRRSSCSLGLSLNITAGNGANALGIAALRAYYVNTALGYGIQTFGDPRRQSAPSTTAAMRVTFVIEGMAANPLPSDFQVEVSKNGTSWANATVVDLGAMLDNATAQANSPNTPVKVFEATGKVSGTGGYPQWRITSNNGAVILRAYQVEYM